MNIAIYYKTIYYKYKEVPWIQPILNCDGVLGQSDYAAVADSARTPKRSGCKAFNDPALTGADNCWGSANNSDPHYVMFYSPTPIKATSYTIRNGPTDSNNYACVEGYIEVSDDGVNWTRETDFTNTAYGSYAYWDIVPVKPLYGKYHKFVSLKSRYNGNYVIIAHIAFNNAVTKITEESSILDYDLVKTVPVYKLPAFKDTFYGIGD